MYIVHPYLSFIQNLFMNNGDICSMLKLCLLFTCFVHSGNWEYKIHDCCLALEDRILLINIVVSKFSFPSRKHS